MTHIRTIKEQVDAMRKDWPSFDDCPGYSSDSIIWIGDLKGKAQTFLVTVEYGLPKIGRGTCYRSMPIVRVLRPRLIPNWNDKVEGALPHVYISKPDITLSPLCLFDPKENQWDPSMLISETTIPWTRWWLAFYEIWRATGVWMGGGRHDEPEPEEEILHAE